MLEVKHELSGIFQEASDSLRRAKSSRGDLIEKSVAELKLKQIVDPTTTKHVFHSMDGIDLFVNGLLDDYSDVGMDCDPTQTIRAISSRVKGDIQSDLETTLSEYDRLTFSEELDPTIVAKDNRERDIILEAANLLGYSINCKEGHVKVALQPRYKVGSDPERIISNRVNVGLKGLLEDYDSPIMRRPVRRMIIAMTDHMSKALRAS